MQGGPSPLGRNVFDSKLVRMSTFQFAIANGHLELPGCNCQSQTAPGPKQEPLQGLAWIALGSPVWVWVFGLYLKGATYSAPHPGS